MLESRRGESLQVLPGVLGFVVRPLWASASRELCWMITKVWAKYDCFVFLHCVPETVLCMEHTTKERHNAFPYGTSNREDRH